MTNEEMILIVCNLVVCGVGAGMGFSRAGLILAMLLEQLRKAGNVEEAAKVASRVIDATNEVVQLDSRADRKRDLLLKLRQSLYLTPRSRAGVAPKDKKEEPPEDPFETLLNALPNRVPITSGGSDDEA